MGTLIIRDLDDHVIECLEVQAREIGVRWRGD